MTVIYRLMWGAACALAMVVLAWQAQSFLSVVYQQAGAGRYAAAARSQMALQSFRHATRLDPFNSLAWADLAYSLGAHADYSAMLSASRESLRLAPADSRLWFRHLLLLVHAGKRDEEMRRTLEALNSRAPTTAFLHANNAVLAVDVWPYIDDDLRKAWMPSLMYARYQSTSRFNWGLVAGRREAYACAVWGDTLNMRDWCSAVASIRAGCDQEAKLTDDQQAWCADKGFFR